jgi:hypothetical protein
LPAGKQFHGVNTSAVRLHKPSKNNLVDFINNDDYH